MFYGITMIIILAAVSGAIAWIGDWLGRRIGKKKVSIFGLRPKHTSILITIVTGIMITSLTLAAIFVVSRTARTSFFGLQQLKKEIKTTKTDLRNKTAEFEKVSTSLHKQKKDFDRFNTKLQKDLANRQQELDGLVGEINLKTSELNKLKKSQIITEKEVKSLTVQRANLEKERDTLITRKLKLEKEISSIASRLVDNQKVILYGDILYKRSQALARIIVEPDISRDELEQNLKNTISVLTKTAEDKGAIIGPDTKMFNQFQIDKILSAVLKAKQEIIVEASSATNVLKGEPLYIELKTIDNSVIFSKNEIIASVVIPANSSENRISDELSKLISKVMEKARKDGILPDIQTGTVGSMSAQRFSAAVSELTNSKTDRTVQLYAVKSARTADKLHIDYRIK